MQIRSEDDGNGKCNTSPMAARLFGRSKSRHRPLKAIIFSQFRRIYEYFGDRLIRRFGGACVADFSYGGTRTQELQKFIHDPQCFIMLLSKQGSVVSFFLYNAVHNESIINLTFFFQQGLDLSFVTHIFFLGELLSHLSCSTL